MRPDFPELPLLPSSTVVSLSKPRLPQKEGISAADLSLSRDRATEARMYAAEMGRAWDIYRQQVAYSRWAAKQEERAINRHLKTKYSV